MLNRCYVPCDQCFAKEVDEKAWSILKGNFLDRTDGTCLQLFRHLEDKKKERKAGFYKGKGILKFELKELNEENLKEALEK